jgi:Sap, sulfolipid-1-addressing protein
MIRQGLAARRWVLYGGGAEGSRVGSVLVQLIPLVIGSMMMPTWVLLVLLLLRKGHGPVEAIAFVIGVTLVKLLQGLIFGAIFGVYHVDHRRSAAETIIISTLLVVVGLLMWVTALRLIFREEDPDAPPSAWMRMISAITPVRALGLGAVLVATSSRSWLFTLAALGIIGHADLDMVQSILAFLLYVAGTELLLVTPILLSIGSARRFDAAANWLEQHERPIVIIASFLVGAFFLWIGVDGLIR